MRKLKHPILIIALVLTIIGNTLFPITTLACDPNGGSTELPSDGIIEDFDGHCLVSSWNMDDKSKPYAYDMDFSGTGMPEGTNGKALKIKYNRENDDNKNYGAFIIEGLFDFTDYDYFSFRVYNNGQPVRFNVRFENAKGSVPALGADVTPAEESDWILPESGPGNLQKHIDKWETLSFNITQKIYDPTQPGFDWSKITCIKFMVEPDIGTGTGEFWIDDIKVTGFPNVAPLADFGHNFNGWVNDQKVFISSKALTSETGALSPIESQTCMKLEWNNKAADAITDFYYDTQQIYEYNSKNRPEIPSIPLNRPGHFPMNTIYQDNNKISMYLQSPTEATVPIRVRIGNTYLEPDQSIDVTPSGFDANVNLSGRGWVKVTWTIPTTLQPNADGKYFLYIFPLYNIEDAQGQLYIDDISISNGSARNIPDAPSHLAVDNATNTLSWDAVPGVTEYWVMQSTKKTFDDAIGKEAFTNSIQIPFDVTGTDTYYYCVKAKLDGYYGNYSTIFKYNPKLTPDQLLDLEAYKAFRFFWDNTNDTTGLIPHIYRDGASIDFARTGSAGYALTAYTIAAQRSDWGISYNEAKDECLKLLTTLRTMQDRESQVIDGEMFTESWCGVLCSFVNVNTGLRKKADVYATPDIFETAKAVCGALTAGEYFGGEVQKKAYELYSKVQWNKFLDTRDKRVYDPVDHPGVEIDNYFKNMLYKVYLPADYSPVYDDRPNDPDLPYGEHWDFNGEQLMIYFLAAGAPNPAYRVADTAVWDKFQKRAAPYMLLTGDPDRPTATIDGMPAVYPFFGCLSGYQLSQCWFNLKDMIDKDGMNWYQNTINGTLANRQDCIDSHDKFSTYDENTWGLTMCQQPFAYDQKVYGAHPYKFDETKPGDEANNENNDNGTVSPIAAIASMPFTYEYSIKAMQNFYEKYPEIFGKYGFFDSMNANVNNANGEKLHKNPGDDSLSGTWYSNTWYSDTVFDYDKGMSLLAISNKQGNLVWDQFMKNKFVQAGVSFYGFKSTSDAIVDDFDGNKRATKWDDDKTGTYIVSAETLGLDTVSYTETGTVSSGCKSLKVDYNKNNSADAYFYAEIKDPGCFGLAENFKCKVYSPDAMGMNVIFETSSGDQIIPISLVQGWNNVLKDVTGIASSLTDVNRIKFVAAPGQTGVSGTIYIDDVKFGYEYPHLETGKEATASSGTGVSNVTDEDSATKWQSDAGAGSYVTVVMGSSVIANTFTVDHAGSFNPSDTANNTRKYRIQVSEDGNKWVNVAWVDSNIENSTTTTLLNPVIGKYYRLVIDKPTQSGTGAANIYGFHIKNCDPLYKPGLEIRSLASSPIEDNGVYEWLKAVQDNSSADQWLLGSQEDISGQTFNNALAAMAFILKGDQERAERILDFYTDGTRFNPNNTDESIQSFYSVNAEGKPVKGFYQEMRLKEDPVTHKAAYTVDRCDRWMGDNVWLMLALQYYKKTYGLNETATGPENKSRYQLLINAVRDMVLDYYTPNPDGPGGFIQVGWRWGSEELRNKANLTQTEQNSLRSDSYLHEYYNDPASPDYKKPVGHEEGNIDCYAALMLLGDERSVNCAKNIKLWLDNRMEILKTRNTLLPLDLYTWRSMAFTNDAQYYKDLSLEPDQNPFYKKIAYFNNERTIGIAAFESDTATSTWLDGMGHVACGLYAAGNTAMGNFYADQYKTYLIDRVIDNKPCKSIPFMSSRLGGYDWVKLDTGFVSPAAWYVFAMNKFNPLRLETYSGTPAATAPQASNVSIAKYTEQETMIDNFDGNNIGLTWNDGGKGFYTLTNVSDGTNCLKVDYSKGSTRDDVQASFSAVFSSSQDFTQKDLLRFKVNGYTKVTVTFIDQDNRILMTRNFELGLSGWQNIEWDLSKYKSINANVSRIDFAVYSGLYNKTGTFYIDDLRVVSRTAYEATTNYTPRVGDVITGVYTYSDAEGNPEFMTTCRWLKSDTANGTYTAIAGAALINYTVTSDDINKYIKFEVTPKCALVPTTGMAVQSAASKAVQLQPGTLLYVNKYMSCSNIDNATSVAISPDGKNAYVVGKDASSVAWFTRDAATGALTYVDKYVSSINICGANYVTVSPDGNLVYVTAFSGNAVAWFTRNTATGALTYAGRYSSSCISGPSSVVISPDGLHAYVTSAYAVAWFTRNTTTGALTYVSRYVGSTNNAARVVVSPDGNHVYVTEPGMNAVVWFTRNTSTGALTYVGMYSSSCNICGAFGLTISPDGLNVYVGCASTVAWFTRDSSTGALTYVSKYYNNTIFNYVWDVVVSPDGKNVYAASSTTNTVAWFNRDSSGALAYADRYSVYEDTNYAYGLAISSDGKNVYTACGNSNYVTSFTRVQDN